MFKFDWDNALLDEIVDSILASAGVEQAEFRAQIREQVLMILTHEGGFPITEANLDSIAIRSIASGLLEDALRRAFPTELAQEADWPGVQVRDSQNAVHSQVTGRTRVAINVASAAVLTTLPGIGEELAKAIIQDRRQRGPFRNSKDVARRIPGLGTTTARRLDAVVHYRMALECERAEPGLLNAIRYLLGTRGTHPEKRLLELLEAAAVIAARRTPDRWLGFRMHESALPQPTFMASTMEILRGSEYYRRMKELLLGASSSIFVAMFHIAFPKETHPTKDLLDALIEARRRQVGVRVLVDQDRPKDPYGSMVINKHAVKYLTEGGVDVRVDAPASLLHSKVVVTDRKTVVIGSHNWSAGSYYQFDDLSVLLECEQAAVAMATRLDAMWADAFAP